MQSFVLNKIIRQPVCLGTTATSIQNMNYQNEIVIRSYSHKELAALYDVSWKTLQKWLKKYEEVIGQKHGHYYTTKQVIIIFEQLGFPQMFRQVSTNPTMPMKR